MRKLFGRSLLAFSMSTSVVATADPTKCPIAGTVGQWGADYCMYLAETDDLAHPDVVACINKLPEVREVEACSAKKKYKTKICNSVVQGRSYSGSVKQCLNDRSFSGPTVRRGRL